MREKKGEEENGKKKTGRTIKKLFEKKCERKAATKKKYSSRYIYIKSTLTDNGTRKHLQSLSTYI
jgi:hypothetical protein